MPRFLIIFVSVCCLWGVAAGAQNVPGCGTLQNAFGPFDYRDLQLRAQNLDIVERRHFTSNVESLASGNTGHVMGDIDYTLRAWPNHHRALNSVGRYALAGGAWWPNPDVRSADCYFRRAISFAQDDEIVHMVFANYLAKRGDRDAARAQYEQALQLAPNAPEVNYNAGLFFLDDGELARAKRHAQIAYGGGYPLPGLRNKIAAAELRQKP